MSKIPTLTTTPPHTSLLWPAFSAREQNARLKLHLLMARLRAALRYYVATPLGDMGWDHEKTSIEADYLMMELDQVLIHLGYCAVSGFSVNRPYFLQELAETVYMPVDNDTVHRVMESLDMDYTQEQDNQILNLTKAYQYWWLNPSKGPYIIDRNLISIHYQDYVQALIDRGANIQDWALVHNGGLRRPFVHDYRRATVKFRQSVNPSVGPTPVSFTATRSVDSAEPASAATTDGKPVTLTGNPHGNAVRSPAPPKKIVDGETVNVALSGIEGSKAKSTQSRYPVPIRPHGEAGGAPGPNDSTTDSRSTATSSAEVLRQWRTCNTAEIEACKSALRLALSEIDQTCDIIDAALQISIEAVHQSEHRLGAYSILSSFYKQVGVPFTPQGQLIPSLRRQNAKPGNDLTSSFDVFDSSLREALVGSIDVGVPPEVSKSQAQAYQNAKLRSARLQSSSSQSGQAAGPSTPLPKPRRTRETRPRHFEKPDNGARHPSVPQRPIPQLHSSDDYDAGPANVTSSGEGSDDGTLDELMDVDSEDI